MKIQSNKIDGNLTKKDKALRIVSRVLRWVILASLLIFVLSATILHVLGSAAPSIHAICPYGGLESVLTFITLGAFIKKILLGTFILFVVTIVLAVVMRRSYCGQLCVFGGLQEFFGKIGRKLLKKRPALPKKLDRVLRYLKYVVLAVTIAMSWITAELWVIPYDPFNALGHLADFNALLSTYLIGFIILLITILGSVVYDRFFCKYLCPVGALYGLVGKASPYAVRIDKEKCIRCGLCNKACPMKVEIMDSKKEKITDIECINCNECVNACPRKGALSTGFSRRMVLKPLLATVLALVIFFAPIAITSAAGSMQLLPDKFSDSRASEAGEEAEADIVPVNGYSESDIKGSMTLSDIAEMLNIPINEMYVKLGLPNSYPKDNTIKSAASYKGTEVSDLKEKLFE